jgi:hypothetical protein
VSKDHRRYNGAIHPSIFHPKEFRMVQPKDPPARTGLEEAVTALFCLVYDPYQQLNPKGRSACSTPCSPKSGTGSEAASITFACRYGRSSRRRRRIPYEYFGVPHESQRSHEW